jgi:hypothetical protein
MEGMQKTGHVEEGVRKAPGVRMLPGKTTGVKITKNNAEVNAQRKITESGITRMSQNVRRMESGRQLKSKMILQRHLKGESAKVCFFKYSFCYILDFVELIFKILVSTPLIN